MMKSTLKNVITSAMLLISGHLYSAGNTVVTQTACVGNIVGDCNVSMTSTAGRLRGDVLRMNLTNVQAQKLGKSGSIKVPDIGAVDLYQYGNREIIFASLSLTNQALNPHGMSVPLLRILAESKGRFPWANSLVIVGQVEPGKDRTKAQVTVLSETSSEMVDLKNAKPISYAGVSPQVVRVTIPASKNQKAQVLTVDFQKVKSQRAMR